MTVISNQWSAVSQAVFYFALCAILFPFTSAEGQQQEKIPRVGFLQRRIPPSADNPDPLGNAFRQGLRELGYIEGKNIFIEQRYAAGKTENIPALITELINSTVDLLVVASSPAIQAAKRATSTIPIIMIAQVDPVASGWIASLAHPGGNLTGLTRLTRNLSAKRLEVLNEAIPAITRVGILLDSSSPETANASLKEYEIAARGQKITVQKVEVRGPKPDFERAFQSAKAYIDALVTIRDALTASHPKRIAELAIKHQLPSMHADRSYVEAGGLMSYATSDAEQFRRAAVYVDKILKGAKPADLPVEQPKKFEFVINLKTAKQIGLTIPPNVLARADRVIK
ncbi:MAG TPA: ABC transporter substrate-binding protein [Candidatus Binatia bacterium]